MNLYFYLGLLFYLAGVSCSHEAIPPKDESAKEASGSESENVAANDARNFGTATEANASPTAQPSAVPMAVDVGNPKGTGASPGGNGAKLYLADAAPVDQAEAVWVQIIGVEVIGDADKAIIFHFPMKSINLMEYAAGRKYALLEEHLDMDRIREVRVLLQPGAPAWVVLPDGETAPVEVPENRIVGRGDFALNSNAPLDLTMHIDLRKQLRDDVTDSYTLLSDADLFLTPTRGGLLALGIDPGVFKVVCARAARDVLPTPPSGGGGLIPTALGATPLSGDSACLTAAGSSAEGANGFRIDYLPPGNYLLELYLDDEWYLLAPQLVRVDAGVLNSIRIY